MQTLETKKYYTPGLNSSAIMNLNEQDLNRKVTKALEKCTNCIYSISNEPTLACYCIEEHLIKTGLQLTDKREEMRQLDKQLSGAIFDIEFSIESIKRMKNSDQNLKKTQDLIKNAIFHKQQADYNNATRKKFQQQMEKDHSFDDFRGITNASRSDRQSRLNAFQRFSESFSGLASSASVDFKEFKDTLKHISQLTSQSNQTIKQNNNQIYNSRTINQKLNQSINSSNNQQSINSTQNDQKPSTSTVLNDK